ncbi:L-lysine exporter family protein LysE/ArgO [Agromyces sp. CF514]|uniref:LysE/ArgO family amino acid transporter n=1 Tax=Agromyces sp. CF514 TaxID=1881031 RepID=UPI0008E58703|nr:LysE/ArgO family amino acid transporter [Agromyces sp. CF514]SFR69695.1 L-lysine exporter family protein LysE/ArgO [Agromyces sp. CF514]
MPLSSALAGLGLGLSLIVAIGAQNLFVLRQGIRREHVFVVAAICALSDLTLIVLGVSGVGAVLQAVPWLVEAVRWAGAAFLVVYGLLAAKRAIRPSGEALVAGEGSADGDGDGLGHGETDAAGGPGAEGSGRDTSAAVPGPAAASASPTMTRPARTPTAPRATRHAGSAGAAVGRTTLTAAVLTCLALTWLNPHVYLDTLFLLGSIASTHGDGRWAFAAGAGLASIVWFFGLAYGSRLLGGVLASPRAWRVLDGVIAVVMITLGVMLVLPH